MESSSQVGTSIVDLGKFVFSGLCWLSVMASLGVGPAQAESPTADTQLPAAWIGKPGEVTGLVDFRGFYQYASGGRPDWSGTELLSYFDLAQGFSGAFVLRQEARDQVARFATLMLIPRLSKDKYLVTNMGFGSGADFQPITRLDVQLRGFFSRWKGVMYDVGGYSTWWTSDRRQWAQSNALIFWRLPMVVEVRNTFTLTDPGMDSRRVHFKTSGIMLWGRDNEQWLMGRVTIGNEPENSPGKTYEETRDKFVGSMTVSYRRWITDDYGISGELEAYGQLDTWYRAGFQASIFADFN